MTNGNYKSIQSMMNRLYRNPMIKNVPETDIAQYVSDAIRLIEAPMAYSTFVECIPIQDNRGLLPCNIIYINQTRKYRSNHCLSYYLEYGSELFKNYAAKFADTGDTFEHLTYATDHFHTAYHAEGSPDLMRFNSGGGSTYSIQGGYIYTSFNSGVVQMSYKGLEVDQQGYPMIPDNIKVEKAIENYAKLQIYQIEWELGKISDKVMNELKRETNWYMGASNTSMQMQSIDQAEAFKAAFTRTILKPLQHSSGFRDLGSQEYIHRGSI